MKLISSDVASFIFFLLLFLLLVRDAVAAAPFRGKEGFPPSVHSLCLFETGQLTYGFLPGLLTKPWQDLLGHKA